MIATRATAAKPKSDLAYVCRALKAPSLARSGEQLAERARAESWTHEEFLAACLEREVAARQDHGGEGRIRAARFPARKTLEDFDFSFQRSLKRDVIAHLGTLDFIAEPANDVFLGPPPARPTSRSASRSVPAKPAIASRSQPPPSGSRASAIGDGEREISTMRFYEDLAYSAIGRRNQVPRRSDRTRSAVPSRTSGHPRDGEWYNERGGW